MSGHDRVAIVGVGDDGLTSLGPRARELVQSAELLCGGHRHLALFSEHPAQRVTITGDVDSLVERISAELGRRRVVVLASGDPCFFGIGPILATRLGRERVEIVPNVSSVALAFARLGESWHDATVLSAHGRALGPVVGRARGAHKLAILTDEVNTPAAIARALLEGGIEDAEAWVFEHLGGAGERCFRGRLSELAGEDFSDLNVLVVLRARPGEVDQAFGRPERELLHRDGLITKAEVRAVSLSKLRLRPDSVVWDIGAGSGSLAVEAAGLAPDGVVYAVERSAEQVELLHKNIVALGRTGLVEVVHDEAPAALAELPGPDAVFVGGTGGSLAAILDLACERLSPGGRIVINLVTVERLATCIQWATSHNLVADVVEVSISHGSEIAGLTRLVANNPVFVVTFERKA
ncbi:MAG TPA: precorrin-6y C5,15-methyltransferase (decarboxylating) subunit CbiE [Chloroflexota bacterium]|nr:precorrin-6y C5,15-methyltransferase (decarboxylating) subunit CbiE [Chloroflexota bacterium]